MVATLELDDKLFDEAKEFAGERDPQKLTALVYDQFIRGKRALDLLEFYNSDCWEGDLDAMRTNRAIPARA
jgi:hypothetical protein